MPMEVAINAELQPKLSEGTRRAPEDLEVELPYS